MKKTNSIKFRLILTFSFLAVLSNFAIGFMTLKLAGDLIKNEAEDRVIQMAAEGAKLVESRMLTPIVNLETIAMQNEIRSMNLEQVLENLINYKAELDFLELGVVTPDGTAYYTDGTESQLGDRSYIIKAFTGESNISDVIISRVINEPVIMVAVPIKNANKVVGVLIGRRDGNALSDLTKDIKHGEYGYSYIINKDGFLMAHDDKSLVMDQISPIAEMTKDKSYADWGQALTTILEHQSGFTTYKNTDADLGKEIRYAGYTAIQGTDWFFVSTSSESEILNGFATLRLGMQVIVFIFLLINVIVVYFLGSRITKPLIIMAGLTEKIASLDISDEIPLKLINQKDETGVLAKSMQHLMNNLRGIISEITDSSLEVASTAQELTATAEQSASASEEVAKAVEDIAKGATEQAQSTEAGSLHAIKLGDIIEENKIFMNDMNKVSENVTEVVNDGLKEVDRLADISNENNEVSKEIYNIIIKTSESTEKIGEASHVIANIAEQTNLLALNASIEAARAGESGKGFSVVAAEIKKLAGQSATSTHYIDGIIQELQNNVTRAVESIANVNKISVEQLESAISTKNKYEAIKTAASDNAEVLDKLNASEEDMVKAINEIQDMLQSLSAIAEENAAGTEEASSAMLEQSASMEEQAKSSEKLAALAESLQTIINRFKL